MEADLLRLARSTGPVLTDYTRGERIELNAPVVARWIAKVADLVQDEAAGAPENVVVALPPSWRTVVWALGAVAAGARVHCPLPSEVEHACAQLADVAILVCDQVHDVPAGLRLVQPMPALALFAADVPAPWLDAGTELMSRPDSLPPLDEPGLLDERPLAAGAQGADLRARWVLPSHPGWLGAACQIVLAGGSVVLVEDQLGTAQLAEIVANERAAGVWTAAE
ncbi:MAG: TIGR03089 family protein [Buchananella hordeovulneris]|nr:TIGR03089 family protein [Buchananella hordeovulneris]